MRKHAIASFRYGKIFLLFIFTITIPSLKSAAGQGASTCTNSAFELGNFNNWIGKTGVCCPVNTSQNGIVSGRHTIMSGNGTDPYTNNNVPVVAPGTSYSARLGNSGVGGQAEKLIYSFTVTPQTALFVYRYAVVLEDPGHSPSEQPRFEIRVFDQNSQLIGCGQYNVVASAGIQGFHTIQVQGKTIVYKNWSAVGIDLTASIGNNITIEFTTADCGFGGHFGYAYISAYCSPLSVQSYYCIGNYSAILEAPAGFQSYVWNTGDTTQSLFVNNPVNGTSYQCTLTSFTGCTVTLSTVLAPTTVSANFSNSAVCLDYVGFLDMSTTNNSGVAGWEWTFGDGAIASVQHPVHTYPSKGNYTVTLIVSSTGGCKDTVTKIITINNLPEANFSFDGFCEKQPVAFNDLTTTPNATVTGYQWEFGDGDSSSQSNPSHVYEFPGIYNAILTITSSDGCIDSVLMPVAIETKPTAQFTTDNNCLLAPVNFTDASSSVSPLVAWLWKFDGFEEKYGMNVSHVFTAAGSHQVTLQVTNSNECVSDTTLEIILTDTLKASFNYLPEEVTTANPLVQFFNQSLGSITYYNWSLGNGITTDTEFNPSHTYLTFGSYPVQLYVENNVGCRDSVTEVLTVSPMPGIYTPNAFTPGGDLVNDHFLPVGEIISEYRIFVFNRWGQKIFEGNINEPWNGRSGSDVVPTGSYAYKIVGKDAFNVPFTKTGAVTVLR